MSNGTWASSGRRHRLPPNWPELRLDTLRADDWVCQIQLPGRCLGTATEVDHIERGDDHSPENLRAACAPCHAKKSSDEGNAAKRRKRELGKRPPGRD